MDVVETIVPVIQLALSIKRRAVPLRGTYKGHYDFSCQDILELDQYN
jgi:hypothetical protein